MVRSWLRCNQSPGSIALTIRQLQSRTIPWRYGSGCFKEKEILLKLQWSGLWIKLPWPFSLLPILGVGFLSMTIIERMQIQFGYSMMNLIPYLFLTFQILVGLIIATSKERFTQDLIPSMTDICAWESPLLPITSQVSIFFVITTRMLTYPGLVVQFK